jgi:hypothetical protein
VFDLSQVLSSFGLAQASDVIILDTPCGDFIEISSSSYDLSIFSSQSGSHRDEGAVATLRVSSSMSMGDAWPEVDTVHGVDHEDAFTTTTHDRLEASTLHM